MRTAGDAKKGSFPMRHHVSCVVELHCMSHYEQYRPIDSRIESLFGLPSVGDAKYLAAVW